MQPGGNVKCLVKLVGKKKKKSVQYGANVQHMVTRTKCDNQPQKVQASLNNCISYHLWNIS